MADPWAMAQSEYHRALYRRNPAYRLNAINRVRRARGRPEVRSLDEVKTRI